MRTLGGWILCGAAALSAFGAEAAARDIFVHNQAGDDRSNGATAEQVDEKLGPVRTIRRAVQIAQKCDRIVVANTGVPYRECVTLQGGRNSGLPGVPFILEGNGAVLEGSRKLSFSDWRPVGKDLFGYYPKKITYTRLYLDGKPAEQVAVPADAKSLPALEPKQWARFGGVVYFRVEPTKMIDDYDLSASQHDVGVTLYQVEHVIVANFVVQGYRLDGFNAADNMRDALVEGVVSRGNGRSGLTVAGSSRLTVAGSVLGDNVEAQLRVEGHSIAKVEETKLLGDEAKQVFQESPTARLTIDGEVFTSPSAAKEPAEPAEPKAAEPKADAPKPEAETKDAVEPKTEAQPKTEAADSAPKDAE